MDLIRGLIATHTELVMYLMLPIMPMMTSGMGFWQPNFQRDFVEG